MTRRVSILAAVAALALLGLASCQQFFTSSWAEPLARTDYAIPANLPVDDAAALLAESNGDPAIAAALVTPLYNAMDAATPGTAAYDEAALALVDAVLASSEVGSALTEAMTIIPLDGSAPTPEQEDAALAAIMSIGLSPLEVTALTALEASPPADMEPADAYAAAVALLAQAMKDVGVADLTSPTPAEQTALDANAAYILAFDFITLGDTLAGGATSMLGDLLSGFASNYPAP